MLYKIKSPLHACIIALMLTVPSSVHADELEENCINRALDNILQGKNITQYVAIENITRTIVGPQWKTLDEKEKKLLKDVVYTVMRARIVAKGKDYIGIRVHDIKIDHSETYAGKVDISGYIGTYFFETIAVITEKECYFYTLSIEGMFQLYNWLGNQPEVQSAMKSLKLKY